jgi:predicted dehydrogenase/type 1 glutamine amidotransferase
MSQSVCPTRHVLLLTGPGSSPQHELAVTQWVKRLEATGRFSVSVVSITSNGAPALANLPGSDFHAVLAMTGQADPLPKAHANGLARFIKTGGGLVTVHHAAASLAGSEALRKLIGVRTLSASPTAFDFKVRFTQEARDTGHSVAVRCDDFTIHDTLLAVDPGEDAQVFAVTHIDGRDTPVGLTRTADKGQVACLACGGSPQALDNPNLLRMAERALRHVCGETFDKTIGVGIIGYGGAFGMGKLHAEALNAQHGCKTVAVCDSDPNRAKQAKAELGDSLKVYTKYQDLLADEKVDLVIVILPHNLHAEVCIAANRAGKHVVTEKPFCITLDQADAMIAAAQEAGTMLSCFHNRRWDGDFRQMLQLIRAGEIGEVFHADAATGGWDMPNNWWRASKPISGGVLYDWGAHYVDWLLNFIPRRIESVSGVLHKHLWHNTSNEDYALVTIRFEGGATATLEQGQLVAIPRAGWRILGTQGGLTNPGPGGEVTLVTHHDGTRSEAKLDKWGPNWHSYYQNIANHLIMDEPLIVTAAQARRTIGIFELAEKSNEQAGKPLELPGEDSYVPDYHYPI